MTAIVIGTGSSGLTFSQGLSIIPGAIFPASASGAGIIFTGSGGLSGQITDEGLEAFITFLGAGSLSALLSGSYTTNPVTFAGAGSLTDMLSKFIAGTFGGTGALTANAPLGRYFINAEFDGSGSLSQTVSLAMQAVSSFSGSGKLSSQYLNP